MLIMWNIRLYEVSPLIFSFRGFSVRKSFAFIFAILLLLETSWLPGAALNSAPEIPLGTSMTKSVQGNTNGYNLSLNQEFLIPGEQGDPDVYTVINYKTNTPLNDDYDRFFVFKRLASCGEALCSQATPLLLRHVNPGKTFSYPAITIMDPYMRREAHIQLSDDGNYDHYIIAKLAPGETYLVGLLIVPRVSSAASGMVQALDITVTAIDADLACLTGTSFANDCVGAGFLASKLNLPIAYVKSAGVQAADLVETTPAPSSPSSSPGDSTLVVSESSTGSSASSSSSSSTSSSTSGGGTVIVASGGGGSSAPASSGASSSSEGAFEAALEDESGDYSEEEVAVLDEEFENEDDFTEDLNGIVLGGEMGAIIPGMSRVRGSISLDVQRTGDEQHRALKALSTLSGKKLRKAEKKLNVYKLKAKKGSKKLVKVHKKTRLGKLKFDGDGKAAVDAISFTILKPEELMDGRQVEMIMMVKDNGVKKKVPILLTKDGIEF